MAPERPESGPEQLSCLSLRVIAGRSGLGLQGRGNPASVLRQQTQTGDGDNGLTGRQQIHGMRYAYASSSLGSVLSMLLAASSVGTLFIKEIGGTDFQAMLAGALPILCRVLQLPTSLIVSPGRGRTHLLVYKSAAGVLMGLAIAAPTVLAPGPGAAGVVVGIMALAWAVYNSGGTFWFPLLYDIVPVAARGRFFGKLRALLNGLCLVVFFLAAEALGDRPTVGRYQLVFAIAIAMHLLGVYFAARITAGSGLSKHVDQGHWREHLASLFVQKKLMVFCGYFMLLGICAGFLAQPMVLYMRQMGLPDRVNTHVFNATLLGRVLVFLAAGMLVDRLGTKRVFLSAQTAMCAVCFAVVAIGLLPAERAKFLMPAALAVSGATVAVAGVACMAQIFHLVPQRGRAFFISLATILAVAGPALSPLAMGGILDWVGPGWTLAIGAVRLSVFQVLIGLAGLGLIGIMGLLRFVDDVRPQSAARRETA